jgi:NADH dehydrogenase
LIAAHLRHRPIHQHEIAGGLPDRRAYHYAESKRLAEEAVRASGLPYLIVRPTVVFGDGSPTWNKLVALARMPVMPVFGDGRARIQPIHVDDVVAYLIAMLDVPVLPQGAVDLGGPDVVTIEALLRRIRRTIRGRESPVVHLPAHGAMRGLALVERWLDGVLPVRAGQLSPFIYDTVAASGPVVPPALPRMKSIDEMLAASALHA